MGKKNRECVGEHEETNSLTLVCRVAKQGAAATNMAIQRRSSEGFVSMLKVRTLSLEKMAGVPGLTTNCVQQDSNWLVSGETTQHMN